MRDEHKRGAMLAVLGEESSMISRTRGVIEIARRFVRQENCGLCHQRARKRHALLLAAG